MILGEIVSKNMEELEVRKQRLPLIELHNIALDQPPPLDFPAVIRGEKIRLIAEIKKASPSRGIIRHDFNPAEIARIYVSNGAAAISVLTEERYFQGSLDYLRDTKNAIESRNIPVLRKDFICDLYQIYESRAYGSDSLLLIVAMLQLEELKELIGISHELDMSCVVEVHNETEVEIALKSGARIIGINNRELTTFTVDLSTTERLKPLIPSDRIVISESGINSRSDIERLQRVGADAVLIGESLMSAPDISAKMKELL